MTRWFNVTSRDVKIHGNSTFNKDMFKSFITANGFTKFAFESNQDYKRFLQTGGNMHIYPHVTTETPPYSDHMRAFKNTNTGVICIISQPYCSAEYVTAECSEWADKRGISADIYSSEYSWYYPGHTCVIVWRLPDVEIKLNAQCKTSPR